MVQIAGLVVGAVAAGWLADRLRIPSILPLLVVGVLVGPLLGWIDPDALLGDLLVPVVTLAVGIILFEGGLSLRFREIEGSQRAIWGLVTVGVLVTWIIGTLAAWLLVGLDPAPALVLAAILVVSGPTVVGPVLRAVRPSRQVASILKWESILIDPIGAMLAVIAYDAIIAGAEVPGFFGVTSQVALFILVGAGAGALVAAGAVFVLRRHWVPEDLLSLFGLASAIVAFTVADLVFRESGLIATTVVGLILSNHRRLRTEPLIRFSEVLRVLLIGVLFIVLSARLTTEQLSTLGWGTAGLILVLILVARPLSVWLGTMSSNLEARQRLFIAGMAPRGIVAVSIASVLGLELEEAGVSGGEVFSPIAFAVIAATVVVYGFGAGPLARALRLASPDREGVLVLGAGPVERSIAEALTASGVNVIVATVNRNDERAARMAGLRTYYGNVLEEDVDLRLELTGFGRLLALTPNDEVNALAARRFSDMFGGAEVYQLPPVPPPPGVESTPSDLGGRRLFGSEWTYPRLEEALEHEEIRRTTFSEEFDRRTLLRRHGRQVLPLFLLHRGRLMIGVEDAPTPLMDRVEWGDELLWLNTADVEQTVR